MSGGRGKHSGSGTRNDIPGQLAQADQLYRQTLGRGITEAEKTWLVNQITDNVSASDMARHMMEKAAQDIAEVQNYASDFGFEFTPDQARGFYNKVAGPITSDIREDSTLMEHVTAQLGAAYNRKLQNPTVDPFTGKSTLNVGDYSGQLGQIFQDTLGRAPRQDELEYFAKGLASGLSSYELRHIIEQSSEYQQKQADIQTAKFNESAAAARAALGQELQNQNDIAMQRAAPQIISSYMKAGRLGSSAVDAALAREKGRIQEQAQNFLANAAYNDAVRNQGYQQQQYVTGQGQAFQNYLRQTEPAYQTNLATAQNAVTMPHQYASSILGRSQELANYNRTLNDWARFNQPQSNNGFAGALYGATSGASAGSAFGPYGALIGGIAGTGLGYAGTRRS